MKYFIFEAQRVLVVENTYVKVLTFQLSCFHVFGSLYTSKAIAVM